MRRIILLLVLLLMTVPLLAQSPDELFSQAQDAGQDGDYDAAIDLLTQAIEAEPAEDALIDYLTYRGELLDTINRNQDAVDDFTQVLTLNGPDGEVLLQRAGAFDDLNMPQQAAEDFAAAVERAPSVAAYVAYADFLRRQNDFDAANEMIDAALEINPDAPEIYTTRALIRRDQNNFAGALQDANTAVELDGQRAESYVVRGRFFEHVRDYERAMANYDRALEINPESASAYLYRANLKGALGNALGALLDFEEAQARDPYNPDLYFARANLYGVIQEYQSAINDLTRALELAPDTVNYYIARGDAHRLQAVFASETSLRDIVEENLAAAIDNYSTALELSPDNPLALYSRGLAYMEAEQSAEALADFERYIELIPSDEVPEGLPAVMERLREQSAP